MVRRKKRRTRKQAKPAGSSPGASTQVKLEVPVPAVQAKPATLDDARQALLAWRAAQAQVKPGPTRKEAPSEASIRGFRGLKPRDPKLERVPTPRVQVRDDQYHWPISLGIPFSSNEKGVSVPGYRVTDTSGLSVRDRMRSLRYAKAYLSGMIAFRPSKADLELLLKVGGGSQGPSHTKCVVSVGQGWYCLKQYSLDYLNPAIIRIISSVATRAPRQVLSIYGASYASLCRRPSTDFICRMGGDCLLPLAAANPRQSVSTLLKCRAARESLSSIGKSANEICQLHGIINRNCLSTRRTSRQDKRRSARARNVTAVRSLYRV